MLRENKSIEKAQLVSLTISFNLSLCLRRQSVSKALIGYLEKRQEIKLANIIIKTITVDMHLSAIALLNLHALHSHTR